jgi:hypothetical protein
MATVTQNGDGNKATQDQSSGKSISWKYCTAMTKMAMTISGKKTGWK